MDSTFSLEQLRHADERPAPGFNRTDSIFAELLWSRFVAYDHVVCDTSAGELSTLRLGFIDDARPDLLLVVSLYGDFERGIAAANLERHELDAPRHLRITWEWCVVAEGLRVVRVVREHFDPSLLPSSAPLQALLATLVERLAILGAKIPGAR